MLKTGQAFPGKRPRMWGQSGVLLFHWPTVVHPLLVSPGIHLAPTRVNVLLAWGLGKNVTQAGLIKASHALDDTVVRAGWSPNAIGLARIGLRNFLE